jgi:hypothetical protein
MNNFILKIDQFTKLVFNYIIMLMKVFFNNKSVDKMKPDPTLISNFLVVSDAHKIFEMPRKIIGNPITVLLIMRLQFV